VPQKEQTLEVDELLLLGGVLMLAMLVLENAGQQAQLVRSGCQQGQGHLYSDPLSSEATAAFFAPPPVRLVAQRAGS
jgi:sensor c-di-GMP phosphodiesterase-like protein